MNSSPSQFQFGPYEFRPETGELFRTGQPVRLAAQPARVLALLLRRAGETVTREEIQAEIWNDGTVVEFDQGLNFCIRQIRAALGEDARHPMFIETIPKRGYRFVHPTMITPTAGVPDVFLSSSSRKYWAAVLAVAAVLLVAVLWRNQTRLGLKADQRRESWAVEPSAAAPLRPEPTPDGPPWGSLEMMTMEGTRDGKRIITHCVTIARPAWEFSTTPPWKRSKSQPTRCWE